MILQKLPQSPWLTMRLSSTPMILSAQTTGKGGIASVIQNWTSELEKRGIPMDVYHSTSDSHEAVRVYEIAQFARFLNRMRSGPRPSLLHVHIGSGHSFARKAVYLTVCHALGIPTIIHLHAGMDLVAFYERHARQRRLFLAFLKRAARVIMVTEKNQAGINKWTDHSLRIHTLYNAPKPSDIPTKQRPVSGRTTVSFLGLFIRAKGIWELLDAAEMIHASVESAHFVLAGDGPDYKELSAEVERRKMDSYVTLPGWVKGKEKLTIFEQTDIFCLPSHSEGFPVSLVEAMSMGVGIVVSEVGGIPEAITDGEHGLLIPPKDPAALAQALITMLQDPQLRKRLGQAAKKRATEHFSVEGIVDELILHWDAVRTPEP